MDNTLAFVFPGQGSQSVGMLDELAAAYPEVKKTFKEASKALGVDLWELASQGPEQALNLTMNTQPALLSAGVAVWRVWCKHSACRPALMAGHSLGEYTALVCAEALDFGDALKLVALRGKLMQEAVPEGEGAMAALLGLEDDKVREICVQAAQNQVLSAANFNSPGQVVISGSAQAVERAIALAKQAGAKRAIPLPVSVPSHCALMQPAADKLAARLRETPLQAPRIPVIHNANVAFHTDPDAIRDTLARQLYQPVRWTETLHKMARAGIKTVLECGPGKVLCGLNKRITPDIACLPLGETANLTQALELT
ncbi:MAG: ACP S-malonyltransferase [Gammaproteobacteria bacterium]|nr:ACP S-malonyltransferase [Gammaproteobacteria bacterium]